MLAEALQVPDVFQVLRH